MAELADAQRSGRCLDFRGRGSNPLESTVRRWRNWQTRTPKERVEKSLEVRVLFSALFDRLAQLVRASDLHSEGRGFEPLSGHMAFEQKYEKAGIDYYASLIVRKISNSMLAYPEFVFLAKVIIGFLVVAVLFLVFRKSFGF